MAQFVADFMLSVQQDRFEQLQELAELMGKPIPEVMENCMYEKMEEYLDQFKNNVPEETE